MSSPTGLLIALHGPTAVGKTGVAIALAQRLGAEILSCDSRQFYREMSIGTAVPTSEELAVAPHHFIQDRSVTEPVTAGGYEIEALARLNEIFTRTQTAIMVGGSGLYARAVTHGLDEIPGDLSIRKKLIHNTLEANLKLLLQLDPTTYKTIDHSNRIRVQRAVEACLASGKPYSTLRLGVRKERPFAILEIALDRPRAELYERINLRVDEMIKLKLEAEALNLLPLKNLAPLQTVGYREWFDYFDNTTSSHEHVVDLIKQNTRRYAKRQLTWLRGVADTNCYNGSPTESGLRRFLPTQISEIEDYIKSYAALL